MPQQRRSKSRILAECCDWGKKNSNWGRTALCHVSPLTRGEKINPMHGKRNAMSLSWLSSKLQPCWMLQGFWLFLVVTRTNFSTEEPTPSTEAKGNLLLLLLFQDSREGKINACNICLWCSKRKCLLPNIPFEKQTITKPTKKRAKKHKKPKKNSTQKEGGKSTKKRQKKEHKPVLSGKSFQLP